MATSPDYLRLASNSSRALADTALDSLRHAVVVVDTRPRHLPVVLANAAARRCLIAVSDLTGLVESSLHRWMAAASVSTFQVLLASLADSRSPVSGLLAWRFAEGEASVMTEFKPLPSAPGQRLVMLTFASAATPESGLIVAVDNMPLAAVILDGDLKVSYANAKARASGSSPPSGWLGVSALWLTPTCALQLDVYARALQGSHVHVDALEVRSSEGIPRWFQVDVQPLKSAAGIVGLVVLWLEATERKHLEQEVVEVSRRERQSIGRDLHDGLGQELTGVALMLRGLGNRVLERFPEAADSVNEIVGLVNHSIENTRSLARGLLPVCTDGQGLVQALQELAARSRDLYGLEVSVRVKLPPARPLDEIKAGHIYCIAQEALTNAARHAHATRVDIVLVAPGQSFLLCISDDGEGIREPKSSYTGMGLNIMKYRAGMVGARLEIAPGEPHGTVVRVIGEQSLTAANTIGPHQF